MKIFASLLFGATALTAAALTTLPAEARSGVAIQVGPGGISIGVDQYRDYCSDYGYRHRYYDNCNRYRFTDAYYSDRGEYYQWRQRHHRRHHNDWRRDDRYDRDDYYRDRRGDDRYERRDWY